MWFKAMLRALDGVVVVSDSDVLMWRVTDTPEATRIEYSIATIMHQSGIHSHSSLYTEEFDEDE